MLREPPENIQDAVITTVMKDLEPSLLSIHTKLGFATIIGGLVSLVVCGQFGLGVTSWADALNHKMHSHFDSITCALICGVLYAVFPMMILRFCLTSPLQFRVLVRKHQPALFLWFAGFGAALAFLGEHGQGMLEYGAWVIAALVAANIIAKLANVLLPSWQLSKALAELTNLGVSR